jgi:hypothetical protein
VQWLSGGRAESQKQRPSNPNSSARSLVVQRDSRGQTQRCVMCGGCVAAEMEQQVVFCRGLLRGMESNAHLSCTRACEE